MEYCHPGTESLWYGNWNRHVCRKGKCAADRHSRSTGVNPSRKQRCCSPSCLWSQAQRDTFDPDNSQSLGYWLTIRHRCICMWSWTEMLIFSFQLRAKTVWIPLRMSTEICRLGEGTISAHWNADYLLENISPEVIYYCRRQPYLLYRTYILNRVLDSYMSWLILFTRATELKQKNCRVFLSYNICIFLLFDK